MNRKGDRFLAWVFGLGLVLLWGGTLPGQSQNSTFTYQGVLQEAGRPVTGSFDFKFQLFDAALDGNAIGNSSLLEEVGVTNGFFTVALSPGDDALDGSSRWLEISVRGGTNTGTFVTLAPRQAITTTPYAIRAARFSGPIDAAQLPATVARLDAEELSFTGEVQFTNAANTFGGSFTGDGSRLTNVPVTSMQLSRAEVTNLVAFGSLTSTTAAGLTNTDIILSDGAVWLRPADWWNINPRGGGLNWASASTPMPLDSGYTPLASLRVFENWGGHSASPFRTWLLMTSPNLRIEPGYGQGVGTLMLGNEDAASQVEINWTRGVTLSEYETADNVGFSTPLIFRADGTDANTNHYQIGPGILGVTAGINAYTSPSTGSRQGELWFQSLTPEFVTGGFAQNGRNTFYSNTVAIMHTNWWEFFGPAKFNGNITNTALAGKIIGVDSSGRQVGASLSGLTWDGTTLRVDTATDTSFSLREEFFGGGNVAYQVGELGWRNLSGGNSMPAAILSESGHPGIFRASTAAASNSFSGFGLSQTVNLAGLVAADGNWDATWIIRASATNLTDIIVGLSTPCTAPVVVNSGAGLVFNNGGAFLLCTNGSRWYLHARSAANGAAAWLDTGVAAQPNVWLKARLRWDSAGGRLYGSLNGSTEVQLSGAAIPNTNMILGPVMQIITGTALAQHLDADFWSCRQSLNR